jgi:hypothetical protein
MFLEVSRDVTFLQTHYIGKLAKSLLGSLLGSWEGARLYPALWGFVSGQAADVPG